MGSDSSKETTLLQLVTTVLELRLTNLKTQKSSIHRFDAGAEHRPLNAVLLYRRIRIPEAVKGQGVILLASFAVFSLGASHSAHLCLKNPTFPLSLSHTDERHRSPRVTAEIMNCVPLSASVMLNEYKRKGCLVIITQPCKDILTARVCLLSSNTHSRAFF